MTPAFEHGAANTRVMLYVLCEQSRLQESFMQWAGPFGLLTGHCSTAYAPLPCANPLSLPPFTHTRCAGSPRRESHPAAAQRHGAWATFRRFAHLSLSEVSNLISYFLASVPGVQAPTARRPPSPSPSPSPSRRQKSSPEERGRSSPAASPAQGDFPPLSSSLPQ